MATFDDRVHLSKGFGLVREAFAPDEPSRLTGSFGIGHVRYPTIGLGDVADAQPLFVNSPYGIAMAHNGNVTNFTSLRQDLEENEHRQINTQCDVEVILTMDNGPRVAHRRHGASTDNTPRQAP